jgi:hypothetical protein
MLDYDSLDEGIRETVRMLRGHGFKTCDSGDGSKAAIMSCAVDFPMVAAIASSKEAMCAEADLMFHLLQETEPHRRWSVDASYNPADGVPCLIATADGKRGGG